MQGRFVLRAIFAIAMTLPVFSGCDDANPAPTAEQKKPEYAADAVAKINAASGDLQKQKTRGPGGPGDMMKK
jgi:hypothetical protein